MNYKNKKVVIIGPVNSSDGGNIGGVADFTESLAVEMGKLTETFLITNTKKISIKNVNVISIPAKSKYSVINLAKIYFKLRNINADVTISGLQYSIPVLLVKHTIKIHFFHGFTNRKYYSFLKRKVMTALDRIIDRNFDVRLANSNFTKVLNEIFFNNTVDKVIPLGVSQTFLNSTPSENKDIDILFVGRLTEAKGVFEILNAIQNIKKSVKVTFVGDGDAKPVMEKYIHDNELNVALTGYLTHDESLQYYQRAKVFISLNTHEPFGITFLEALISKCNIICPNTGGQVEFLSRYSNNVCFLNNMAVPTITKSIEKMVTVDNLSDDSIVKIKNYYNYTRVAKDILNCVPDN